MSRTYIKDDYMTYSMNTFEKINIGVCLLILCKLEIINTKS